MEEQMYTIRTSSGQTYAGHLKGRKNISMDGKTCLLSEYDIEGYGLADFINAIPANGEFRRMRSMIPFEYLFKTGRDFDWSLYGDKLNGDSKKLANAFVLNFKSFKTEGKGLYVYSETRGSGKTMLACCLANEVAERFGLPIKYMSVIDYLELTKKGYKKQEEKEEQENIRKTGLLVLDDIGVELSNEWTGTILYGLIDFRYVSKRPTIITSNIPIDGLHIDSRVKDRINAMCIPIPLPEVPVRSIMAADANRRFLNRIM